MKNPRSPDYVPSVFTSAPLSLSPNIRETNAFEPQDKQEAQVEAANALLFLQGQGRYDEGHIHNRCRCEHERTSTCLNSDDERRDGEGMEEMGSGSENESREEEPLRTSVTKAVIYEAKVNALRKENLKLKESLVKMSLTEASFKNDPEKVQFYTGLPNYFVFETVMWLLVPHMKGDKNAKLSNFQQILLTLMRLRLDLRNQDLAYRFGVKVSTVTRTVHRIINIMFTTLVPTAVFWPSRVELRKNLPEAVKRTHPDCAVIIDCFKVCQEKAVSIDTHRQATREMITPSSQSALISELKYVIGVAPQGAVIFASRGAPGNTSDKTLVESCGLLCKLLPGDVVLAERDFDIKDLVGAHRAELTITTSELHEIDQSNQDMRDNASERMNVYRHVDRVIQMVKKRYSVLTGPVESAFTVMDRSTNVTTFDKMVQVACALNNLCISAVPLD